MIPFKDAQDIAVESLAANFRFCLFCFQDNLFIPLRRLKSETKNSKFESQKISSFVINPPMVKPFRLTYLGKGTGGGGWLPSPSLNLSHRLSDLCLLLSYRPILGLSECKLKVVNICEMHGTGGLEVVVFDQFSNV